MKADIIASCGTSWIDRIISIATQSPITHVAMKIDDDFIMESTWVGVKMSKYSKFKTTKHYILRCHELSEEQQDQVVKFIKDAVDVPYDYRLFFGLALERFFGIKKYIKDSKDKYMCIELIIEAFKSVGVNLLPNIVDEEIEPDSLLYSPYLMMVNE